jgi:hypothetical protein
VPVSNETSLAFSISILVGGILVCAVIWFNGPGFMP